MKSPERRFTPLNLYHRHQRYYIMMMERQLWKHLILACHLTGVGFEVKEPKARYGKKAGKKQ